MMPHPDQALFCKRKTKKHYSDMTQILVKSVAHESDMTTFHMEKSAEKYEWDKKVMLNLSFQTPP